jgi:predicted ATPase
MLECGVLTRIEIDGFKTFTEFSLNFVPFQVIVGANASGKSNLFDAIQLLSRLAYQDIPTAVGSLRGEPIELFRREPGGSHCKRITLAAEVLLHPTVQDPWEAREEIRHTRLRYEVSIERKAERGAERLVVSHEQATPLPQSADTWKSREWSKSKRFIRSYCKYGRKVPFLETRRDMNPPQLVIRQDGSGGRTRYATAAQATVLSSITSTDFVHLFALREELLSWKYIQLEPSSLRKPSDVTAPDTLLPDGSNLAKVLARIQNETRTERRPRGILADISADLATLVPTVKGVEVRLDEHERQYRIDIDMKNGEVYSARVASDGTLRVLAFLTMLHDPRHRGLVCFEEPENGVHPGRLKQLVTRLQGLVTDIEGDVIDPTENLSQLILNSHSPVVLAGLAKHQMYFAEMASYIDPSVGTRGSRTIMRAVMPEDQGNLRMESNGKAEQFVTRFEVDKFLSYLRQEDQL